MTDSKDSGEGALIGFVIAGIMFAWWGLCIHFAVVEKVSATIIDKRIQPSEYRTLSGWVIVIKNKSGLPEPVYVTEAQYESLNIGQTVNLEMSTARMIDVVSYKIKSINQ